MLKVYCGKISVPGLKGHVRDIRPLWLLEEMGIPFETVFIDLQAPEHTRSQYLAVHPLGKVPAINDNGLVLFESAAIVTYLASKHGLGHWIPIDQTAERGLYDTWLHFAATTVDSLAARILVAKVFGRAPEAIEELMEEIGEDLKEALKVVNQHLDKNEYLLGSGVSAADIVMTSAVGFADSSEFTGDLHNLRNYLDRLRNRPAYQKAYEMNTGH